LENIISGFSCFKILFDDNIQAMILNGSRSVLNEKYLLNFPDFVDINLIQFSFAIFSSSESFSQIQKNSKLLSSFKKL